MKTPCFLTVLLLVVSTASGQLQPAEPDRLADYLNWFGPLDPSAGLVAPSQPSPSPAQIDNIHRDWSSWVQNAPPYQLYGPITGITSGLFCEVVFLGQTGDCWGQFGYSNNNADHPLSATAADRQFGSYALPLPTDQDHLDFYVERLGADGNYERYFAFDHSRNSPLAPVEDGYWGTLAPLSSLRNDFDFAFSVLAFEYSDPSYGADPALFVFAVRAGAAWNNDAVPEPGTYGLVGGAALLTLIVWRRFRATRTSAG